ncbi:hypothetical protein [Candidatus Fokinia crypta]|uniref:Uncharacterized protein n=1 Tax=Candidatus Fokinia crypta TaxID=1920990 RepID=A0ABZ0URA0_9RICK|nr:hypothetical protein [Candidatus Fokinia cryptica]WPX97668.1 hypothetical protein Fokcrypt_00177 [Candidatus Fokinia cryptica]
MQTHSVELTNSIKAIFDIIYDKIKDSEYKIDVFWIFSESPLSGPPHLLWGAPSSDASFLKIRYIIESGEDAKQLVMKIAREYFEKSVKQQVIESQIQEQHEISMLTTQLSNISLASHVLPEYADRANAIEIVKRETKKICDTYMDSNIVYGIHSIISSEHGRNNFGEDLSSVVNRLYLHGIHEADTMNSIMSILHVLEFHSTLRGFVLDCMLGYHYNTPIQDPDHPEPQEQQAPGSDDLSCSHDSIPGDLETNYPEQMEDM